MMMIIMELSSPAAIHCKLFSFVPILCTQASDTLKYGFEWCARGNPGRSGGRVIMDFSINFQFQKSFRLIWIKSFKEFSIPFNSQRIDKKLGFCWSMFTLPQTHMFKHMCQLIICIQHKTGFEVPKIVRINAGVCLFVSLSSDVKQ